MEAKLREYRALRRRKELIDNAKEKLENTKQKVVGFLTPNIFKDMEKKEDEVLLLENEEARELPGILYEEPEPMETALEATELESFEEPEKNPESWRYFTIKWTIYTIIWLTLYLFFLQVGFGAVFFTISVLVGICVNTSTRRKKPGEASAYSVFNRNCESIDGTLKAEELQRQMLYGAAGMRIV